VRGDDGSDLLCLEVETSKSGLERVAVSPQFLEFSRAWRLRKRIPCDPPDAALEVV
jgi:hypothetical protein